MPTELLLLLISIYFIIINKGCSLCRAERMKPHIRLLSCMYDIFKKTNLCNISSSEPLTNAKDQGTPLQTRDV